MKRVVTRDVHVELNFGDFIFGIFVVTRLNTGPTTVTGGTTGVPTCPVLELDKSAATMSVVAPSVGSSGALPSSVLFPSLLYNDV